MVNLHHFAGLIFADMRTHVHYVQSSFLTGLIFMVRRSSTKTVKIGPLENFPLYGMFSVFLGKWLIEIHVCVLYECMYVKNIHVSCFDEETVFELFFTEDLEHMLFM